MNRRVLLGGGPASATFSCHVGVSMVTAFKRSLRAQVTGVQRLGWGGGVRGSLWAWPSVDLQEEPVVSLGNALPTETATASVDSCSVLQAKTSERGKSGKRAALMPGEWKLEMSAEIPPQ